MGAIVITDETGFSKRYRFSCTCYTVKGSKAVWADFADVALNAEGIEHESLTLEGDHHVPRYDACLAIAQIEFMKAQHMKHVNPGLVCDLYDGVVGQMAGGTDVSCLDRDPVSELIARLLVQSYAWHAFP